MRDACRDGRCTRTGEPREQSAQWLHEPLRPCPSLAWRLATHPRWLFGTIVKMWIRHGAPHYENLDAVRVARVFSASGLRSLRKGGNLQWKHIQLIRRKWQGNLVIKGILSPCDVATAREAGADAVIVSNHGGRQLDCAIASLSALSKVIDAVGTLPVMVDGGFRRGTDILKALALGACMTFLGRPFNYALSIEGASGVGHLAGLLSKEIDRNMAFLGLDRLAEINSDFLYEH